MRIAVFVHGGVGGGQHQQGMPPLHLLLQELAQRHDVVVYNHKITEPDSPKYTLHAPPKWVKPPLLRWVWLTALFFIHHLKHRYQVLHGFWAFPGGKIALILGSMVKKPAVVTFMGGESANLPDIDYGLLASPNTRAEVLKMCQKADMVVLLSEHAKANLIQAGAQFHKEQIIHFGISTELFEYRPNSIKSPYKFVSVGNLHPTKDTKTLIEGFALFLKQHDAYLTVVGGDWWEGEVQAHAKALGVMDKVSFTGEAPYSEVANYIQQSDVLLHTSRHEGQGLIFMEAMASGTLVVATPVGTAADLGGTAVTNFAVQDPEALAEELSRLLHDPERMAERLSLGKAWADEHTVAMAADAYEAMYKSVWRG